MAHNVLGIDVSTACTGISVIDPLITSPLLLTHVTFEKDKAPKRKKGDPKVEIPDLNIYQKAERVRDVLKVLVDCDIGYIAIEEPLLAFGKMASSAFTIAKLQQFNGIISFIAKDIFDITPVHINASHARKLCGVKFNKNIEGDRKQQTFDWLTQRELKDCTWPMVTNKKGVTSVVEWAKDEVDSWVVGRAFCVENGLIS